MSANRKIAQESDFASRQLLREQNTPDNEFGGNFSQRILNPRNAENAAVNAQNAKEQRKLYKPSVPREPSPVHASTKLQIDPKAQTTAPTVKPQVNSKPTGYVHRNKGQSETPPVTTGGNPITEFLGSPQVTEGLQRVIGGGAAALTILGSGLKSLFVGNGI